MLLLLTRSVFADTSKGGTAAAPTVSVLRKKIQTLKLCASRFVSGTCGALCDK